MSNTTIGIDSIPISLVRSDSKYKSLSQLEQAGSKDVSNLKGFFSVLGIAVVVADYEKFCKAYSKALKETLEKNGYDLDIDYSKTVLCSKDFKEYSEGEVVLHETFFEKIRKDILKLNIIFSSFDAEKIPEVKILGRTRNPENVHPKILTIKHLNNSFPHICLWKLLQYASESKSKVFLDHFDGKRTHAWEEIESNKIDLDVYYKGDECNPLISTADILLRCLESRIEANKDSYDYNGITKNLKEFPPSKLHIHNINIRHYPKITPRDQRNIPLKKYIKRPVFYIISPKSSEIDVNFFICSPAGKKFLSKVYSNHGCYKIFSKNEDRSLLKDGDFLVYIDDEGKKTSEVIMNSCGRKINIMPFKE